MSTRKISLIVRPFSSNWRPKKYYLVHRNLYWKSLHNRVWHICSQIIDYIFRPLCNYRYGWEKVNFATMERTIHRKKYKLLNHNSLRYAYKSESTPQKLGKENWFSNKKKYRIPAIKWAAYKYYNEMKNTW